MNFYIQDKDIDTHYINDPNYEVCFVSDTGLVRSANEDHCGSADTPNGSVFVVCDGMGGHACGREASTIAVNSIIKYLQSTPCQDPRQALHDALMFANNNILDTAEAHPEMQGMGTTACVVLQRDKQIWIAHIGDSRIYLFTDHEFHRITHDHSYVQTLVDKGEISDAEAEHHPHKNRILKALGIRRDMEPEICPAPIAPALNDMVLICSDGLCGLVNDLTMGNVLAQCRSLQETANILVGLAKQAGGSDNITVGLVKFTNTDNLLCSTFKSYSPAEYRQKFSSPKEENLEAGEITDNTINNGTAPVDQPTPQPPKQKNKNKKTIIAVASFLLVAAIAVPGYFAFKKLGQQTTTTESVSDETTTPETIEDEKTINNTDTAGVVIDSLVQQKSEHTQENSDGETSMTKPATFILKAPINTLEKTISTNTDVYNDTIYWNVTDTTDTGGQAFTIKGINGKWKLEDGAENVFDTLKSKQKGTITIYPKTRKITGYLSFYYNEKNKKVVSLKMKNTR